MRPPGAAEVVAKSADDGGARARLGLLGLFLGLALLKFGIPVVSDGEVTRPESLLEVLISPWPVAWGYFLFVGVSALCVPLWRWPGGAGRSRWWRVWVWLPGVWFGWQCVAGVFSQEPDLTAMVLPHFAVCTGLFALGLGLGAARLDRVMGFFWAALCGSLLVVFAVAWRQHFGGLEETRQFLYSLPNWRVLPPEFLQKVASDRVYGTLVYPNTLAGVVLLLTPVAVVLAWHVGRRMFNDWRAGIGPGLVVTLAVGSLYWSGSKGGWLLAVGQLGLVAMNWCPGRFRGIVVVSVVLLGVGVFGARYASYFRDGAKSVSARFDYWNSCLKTLKDSPVVGNGPGSFQRTYARNRSPGAEPARLAHNDYLQQAADSGVIGMAAFVAWFMGGVAILYRDSRSDVIRIAVWVGLAAIAGQSWIEFGLYVPAVSWVAFFLFGWLGGQWNAVDKVGSSS